MEFPTPNPGRLCNEVPKLRRTCGQCQAIARPTTSCVLLHYLLWSITAMSMLSEWHALVVFREFERTREVMQGHANGATAVCRSTANAC